MKDRIVLEKVKGGCSDCFFKHEPTCPSYFTDKCKGLKCWQQVEEPKEFCEWTWCDKDRVYWASCGLCDSVYYKDLFLLSVNYCRKCGLKIKEIKG